LVEDEDDLRRLVQIWLGATLLLAILAVISLALFAGRPDHPLLDITLFGFGSLPEGPYPRLRLSFENANMLCHYLSISLLLTLVANHVGWLGRSTFKLLLAAILITAAFTLSPGLGAILSCGGLWAALVLRQGRPRLARYVAACGLAGGLAFLGATMIAPQVHETAPFLIEIPFTHLQIAPSGRIMTWQGAMQSLIADPIHGRGLGLGATSVFYLAPTGMQNLTDAHNMFLNVGAETGVPGLLAILLMAAWLVKAAMPFTLTGTRADSIRAGLGFALLGAFIYQGLAGSFEDARHLWVLIGLFLAAIHIGRDDGKSKRFAGHVLLRLSRQNLPEPVTAGDIPEVRRRCSQKGLGCVRQ
jgi:O-antigen ligase